MHKILLLLFFLSFFELIHGQSPTDSTNQTKSEVAGDDPSQFITRMEFFNELQHFKNTTSDFYLNQTTFRTVVKLGNRFTTRLDIPFVYNSFNAPPEIKNSGFGDISFRLLGYKFLESGKSAITASIEISLNTANSRLTGTGKNIILPVLTYTNVFKDKRYLLACILQQAISFSGDETRNDINFTKIQPILLRVWTKKVWTVLAPELYIDYIGGGASMNLEGRVAFAPVRRINIWAQVGAGLFGDFAARYEWGTEVGCRYFFLRNTIFKRKSDK